MGHIIATVNMKGGVGKTTLTVNLAASLVKERGKRVLVVDLDTQINATLSTISMTDFAKLRKEQGTLKHLIKQAIQPETHPKISIKDVIVKNSSKLAGLDVLPGDIDLYDEHIVSATLAREFVKQGSDNFDAVWNRFENKLVQEILQPILEDYDFILLDCAPGYNLLTRSALIASHFYLMPAKPEPLSLVGMELLQRRIRKLRESHSFADSFFPQLLGIVFSGAGGSAAKYYAQVMQRVIDDFGADKIFKTQIPINVDIAKAVDSFTPVVLSAPNTIGAKAFSMFTREFLQKVGFYEEIIQRNTKLRLANLD